MKYLLRIMLAVVPVMAALAFASPAGATELSNTVQYGTDPLQTVTIYASTTPDSPAVVLIDGGGFTSSAASVDNLVPEAKRLQSDGVSAFIVNYRDDNTAPAFPHQVDDVVAGTRWVIAYAADYNAAPGNLAMVGGSAGGLLVGDAVEHLNAKAPGTVKTVLTLSSTGNLAMMLAYWSGQTGRTAANHLANILPALGCASVSTCPVALENKWSPDQNLKPAECPTQWLIYESHRDYEPEAGSEAMDAALQAARCDVTDTLLPGDGHGYHLFPIAEPDLLVALGT
jgi:acetyl esterase/lipase